MKDTAENFKILRVRGKYSFRDHKHLQEWFKKISGKPQEYQEKSVRTLIKNRLVERVGGQEPKQSKEQQPALNAPKNPDNGKEKNKNQQ